MLIDDDTPKPKPRRLEPLVLDLLGVEELRDYRSAADAFFRKP